MVDSSLWDALDRGRRRLGLTKTDYAKRVGLTPQALDKIKAGGGVNGDTLARLQTKGAVHITRKLIAALERAT